MISYIIRRLLAMIPALLGIALITFVLMHLTKGGPFDTEKANAAVLAAQNHVYHLDEPVWPTFLGSGGDVARFIVLALGILLVALAFLVHFRKIGPYSVFRVVSGTLGALLLV